MPIRRAELPPYPSASAIKPSPPGPFTGDDEAQNAHVGGWVRQTDAWMRLSGVAPEHYVAYARMLVPARGSADEWIQQEAEQLAAMGKEMTWDYLADRMVQHYARPSADMALEAELAAIRMGIKDGPHPTMSVKQYTDRFLFLLHRLMPHVTRDSADLFVRQRYEQGIRIGYPALYKAMRGGQTVLRLHTLDEWIAAAERAEADLAISRAERDGAPQLGSGDRFRGGPRAYPTALNGFEAGSDDDGGAYADAQSPQQRKGAPKPQLNAFRYDPDAHDDKRYRLSEKEAQMLYREKRCYRCHKKHPVGVGHPRCTNPPATTAPRPLQASN